jgi:hypothetical protein
LPAAPSLIAQAVRLGSLMTASLTQPFLAF